MATRENIQVAIRIRPRLPKDIEAKSGVITNVTPGEPQVSLNQHSFTFDQVFDVNSKQDEVYESVVQPLVDGCFDGFNATIFAYGQTGSGKTHTMGTCFDMEVPQSERGILPRALEHFFNGVRQRRQESIDNQTPPPEFSVSAQFIEIYNEELRDLCAIEKRSPIHIVEDPKLGIVLKGAASKQVESADEALEILKRGSLFRTTAATRMNAVSSRSHAVFTLFIQQNRFEKSSDKDGDNCDGDWVRVSAKFNFVDLAGSERLARTMAEGERMREGININCGLLHLGNVIAKLGDPTQNGFVNYRDSKLTRILQDSLGGNSVTTMIACISPCDFDFVETLNTLIYANRAKNIKNKAVANQDSNSQLISELKKKVAQLEFEIIELRQGKIKINECGDIEETDNYIEVQMLRCENEMLQTKNKTLLERYEVMNIENIQLNARIKSSELVGDGDSTEALIKGYLETIHSLELKLKESENVRSYYQNRPIKGSNGLEENYDPINAKAELKAIRDRLEMFNKNNNFGIREEIESDDDVSDGDDSDGDNFDCDEQDSDDQDDRAEHESSMEKQSAQLASLIAMIESKEKLINDHEERSQKFRDLTDNYEKKITECKEQIKDIEKERDSQLKKISDENKTKRIKEMEKEVDNLHRELKRFERMKNEHENLIHKESKNREDIRKMRQEVTDAKAKRIQIIHDMKKAQSNFQKATHKQRIEMNRLINQDVKKNLQINNLQTQSRQQKAMIKRKNEEIVNLKKRYVENGRGMNSNSRTPKNIKRVLPRQTPQKVRQTWHNFEKRLDDYVKNKLQFEYEEKKLNNYFKQKEDCVKLLEDVSDDHEYIEDLKQNLDFIQKNIEDCQNVIVGLDAEDINWDQIYSSFSYEEVGYFLNKLTQSSLNYAILSWQREEIIHQKENTIKEYIMEIHRLTVHNDLLNKMIGGDNNDLNDTRRIARRSDGKRKAMRPEELLYSIEEHEETQRQKEIMKHEENMNVASEPCLEESDDNDSSDKQQLDATIIVNSTKLLKGGDSSIGLTNAPSKKNGGTPVDGKSLTSMNSTNKSFLSSLKNETFPMVCMQSIFAHGRTIQSICATEDLVISGSRDGTAKIWDINTGEKTAEFADHPDIVNVVRYHNINKQLFTVSNTIIKIWDSRGGDNALIKVLSSFGSMSAEPMTSEMALSIEDIRISQCDNYLYYTCDRIVEVIDLRNYKNVAQFNTGHDSKINCIAISENSDSNNVLATGSKDHNVKLFDVNNLPSGINTPKQVFTPSHNGGVEALKLTRNCHSLFSSGRDGYIKKYNVQSEKIISTFGYYLGGVYVCSLDLMLNESLLISGYQNGVLRLWSAENFQPIGETLAHPKSEHLSIASNTNHCFTAGSEGKIKIWKVPEDSNLNSMSF